MFEYDEIGALVQEYIRVLHEGDVEGIRRLFLPECDLICSLENGSTTHTTLDEYLKVVAGRAAPKDGGHPQFGRVVSLDVAGPHMAFIKLESAVQPKYFLDYLIAVKQHNVWRVATKIYYVLHDGT